ncbi:MAG: helix-turn-helix domain-containing protein [Firmicutes bacterium]|nr:helix-turn-helix domain-containing protein [Bacillota bacterium]
MNSDSDFLTVAQVAEELQANYQKVLYMIRTNKLPAKKEGKAFKIPSNYRELMVEKAKENKGRKKRASKKGRPAVKDAAPRAGRAKKLDIAEEQLAGNLAKAIMDLVEYQVSAALNKSKKAAKNK